MKEKFKNFLLKIKKFFNKEHSFITIELIIICILINLLTMTLSYYELMSQDYCFNETHIEQIEESPQTESLRIDRDIKGANPTQSDYVVAGSYYDYIYFDSSFDFSAFLPTVNYYVQVTNSLSIYPIYAFVNWYQSNLTDILCFSRVGLSDYKYYINVITYNLNIGAQYSSFNLFSSDFPTLVSSFVSIHINSSYNDSFASVQFGDNDVPIGIYNSDFYECVSTQPFESSSTPTLDNAPSSLVNTLPTNALTTAPSGLGTLVYDTGSNFVGLPTGSNANTLGVQIYYKSTWNQTTTNTYVEYEGVNYYYNKPTPTITLSEVNVVIYTLWDDTTIYYNVGNVLDTPLTNYAVTSFDFFNWFNMFYSSVNVINEYSDYWHLDFDIDYQVEYQNKVTSEYGNVISYVDYGFEMLIPHNVSLTDIGYKGFSMEKFIELDSNFYSAYIWIGEQTATNFVNQVFERLYDNAYEEGDSDGFARGFDLNGDAYENATNPILNFINKGASIISNVLNVEVLPNITLGTIFLFPLVIAMIWFVVKLFMGG